MEPMLKVTDLSVSYGHVEALRGVSIQVEQGQIVSIIGANGAGKSTLLRTISGLVNSWNEMNPGHFPFKDVIAEMKEEIYRAGGLALELPITGICDGICSNTPGDRYTLPARDMVSTEVETMSRAGSV